MTDNISDLLEPARINLELKGRKTGEVLKELVDILTGTGELTNPGDVYRDLLERERSVSTGVGDGIAIPHAFSPKIDRTIMAFGRCNHGARFNAVDNKPVKLFFLMLGPTEAHTDHLRILSRLSRLLHDTKLRKGLLSARSPEEVIELIRRKEV